MKKNIKKIICVLLSVITLLMLSVSVSAYDYGENDVIIDYIPGDIDNNGKVNATDARLCLRAAAKLETLTEEQLKAADFDGTGEIDSTNARKILRACAKLETLTITVNIEQGQRIVVGPLKNTAGIFTWDFKTDSAKTEITGIFENNSPPNHTGMFDQVFTILTDESNSFLVTFQHVCPWIEEINNSFNLNFIITD